MQKVDFSGCSSLNTLSKDAFQRCQSLKEIVIDNGFYKSQDGVLYTADMATLVFYPVGKENASFAIPQTVVTIQSGAFDFYLGDFFEYNGYKCPLKELSIPASVTNIQPNAFSYYSNKTIHLLAEQPIGLSEDIGLTGALVYVPKGSLAAYKEAAIWKDYTLLEEGAEGITIQLESAGSLKAKLAEQGIETNTIQELTITGPMNGSDFEVIRQMKVLFKCDLSEASIEENSIPYEAFKSSFHLRNIALPYNINNIENAAFSGTNIASVDFANTSLSRIGYNAFQGCPITGSLVFPATLNDIDGGAFDAATVSSIKLKSTEMVRLTDNTVFESVDKSTCKVYVPKGLGNTYKADTYWSVFGNNIVEFGNIVTATANNANYGTVSGSGAYEEGETVTLQANMNDAESFGFGGWYENNSRISTDLTYSFTMNNEDRSIEARFYNKNGWWEEVDDSNKIDGISITTSGLTVNGSIPWHLNSFTYNGPFTTILYIDSPVSAEKVEVKAHPEHLCSGWNFISLPYDVRISDIEKPYKDSQFVIRQYDGATRAAKGMGNSWKQLKEEDVMKANQGYIMKINHYCPVKVD